VATRGGNLHLVPELELAMEEPSADAAHLTRVLESLPVCLMRVGTDGLLLAANQAALGLLGTSELADVLGTALIDRIARKDQPAWLDFTRRIARGTSSSLECELCDLAGGTRPVSLQGAPLLEHPDRIPSIFLIARDTSSGKALEDAVLSQTEAAELESLRQQLAAYRAQLEERAAERQGLDGLGAEGPASQQALAEQQQRIAALEAQLDLRANEQRRLEKLLADSQAGQQSLAEQHQLALLTRDREARDLAVKLEAAAARHAAERAALELAHGTAIEQLRAEYEAQRQGTEGQVVAGLRAELEELAAERRQLAEQMSQQAAQQQALAETHVRERAELLQRIDALVQEAAQREQDTERQARDWSGREQEAADRQRAAVERASALESQVADARGELRQVQASLAQARTEREEMEAAHRAAVEPLMAECAAQRHAAEEHLRRLQEAVERASALESQVADARGELRQVQASLAQARTEREDMEAAHRAAVEPLVAECAAQRHAADEHLLRTRQLQASLTELQSAREAMEVAHAAALERLRSDHEAQLQRSEEQLVRTLRAEVEDLAAERQRLTTLVAQQEAVAAAHAAERVELQHQLTAALEAAALRDQEAAGRMADADARLEQLGEELRRLKAAIIDAEAARVRAEADRDSAAASLEAALRDQRQLAEAAERAIERGAILEAQIQQARASEQAMQVTSGRLEELEAALLASAQRQDQLVKAVADGRLELDALSEQLRQTETMVAGAWLVAAVGRELQRHVVSIEMRSKYLLGQSTLESGARSEVEALRVDAIRATSLARQIARPASAVAQHVAPITPVMTAGETDAPPSQDT
jgi:hypothetical protein